MVFNLHMENKITKNKNKNKNTISVKEQHRMYRPMLV